MAFRSVIVFSISHQLNLDLRHFLNPIWKEEELFPCESNSQLEYTYVMEEVLGHLPHVQG